MKYSILIVFITTLFSGFSMAQTANLSVSPKVCAVSEQHEFCDLDLQFNWHSYTSSDVCLYHNDEQLQCWQQQRSGHFNYKARVQVETIYSLINPHTGALIASTQIEVQSAHAKKNRRRLRSPWSFF